MEVSNVLPRNPHILNKALNSSEKSIISKIMRVAMMWYENLEGNCFFLKTLYKEVPKLENIRIEGIYIKEEGRKATLHFDMPFYADHPPEKWTELGYNSISLEIDVFDIYYLEKNMVRYI